MKAFEMFNYFNRSNFTCIFKRRQLRSFGFKTRSHSNALENVCVFNWLRVETVFISNTAITVLYHRKLNNF